MSASPADLAARVNAVLGEEGVAELAPELAARFGQYAALLLHWNARMNLTSVRDEDGILRRHFAECIRAAQALPRGINTLLDFGSGAGFPGIPIALCRPEIAVTLAESQGKKASFLWEAVRTLNLPGVQVHRGRAEELPAGFGCVALRAVDKMPEAVKSAAKLVRPGGWVAILTTEIDAPVWHGSLAGVIWSESVAIGGEGRVLALGQR